jgi:hypothetical protein
MTKKPPLPKAPRDKKPQPTVKPAPSKEVSELMGRLRLLEERYSGLRKKSQFTEQNMIKDLKELFDEIRVMQDTMMELKSELSELNEKMGKLTREVKSSVRKEELNVLVKYLDFWEPMNFLTYEQAQDLLKRQ